MSRPSATTTAKRWTTLTASNWRCRRSSASASLGINSLESSRKSKRALTKKERTRQKRGKRKADYLTDLERSHAELRAAILIAGKHIRKLSFGRKDDPVLAMLRRVLREARRAEDAV